MGCQFLTSIGREPCHQATAADRNGPIKNRSFFGMCHGCRVLDTERMKSHPRRWLRFIRIGRSRDLLPLPSAAAETPLVALVTGAHPHE